MSQTAPGPVPAAERIAALDVVRGLAVLGILAMNIVEFGLPIEAYDYPPAAGGTAGWDRLTWLVQSGLFEGRMRAIFSMLFGAGIVLIGERMARKGQDGLAADLLLRRCLWLIPFGIAHRFLLQWTGDILYMYGLLGALAVAFRRLRPRTQIVLGLLAMCAFVPIEERRYQALDEVRVQAVEAGRLAAAGEPVPPALAAARDAWQRRTGPMPPSRLQGQIEAMHGSWTDIVRFRWDFNHYFQSSNLYYHFVWDVMGMILLGMGLLRLGFLSGRLAAGIYVGAVLLGAVAAAVSWWQARAWADSGFSRALLEQHYWRQVLHPFLRCLGALGWTALLILTLRSAAGRRLTRPLAAVGRMAFSNYVLQTVVCTAFFFGWGLGHYGEFSRAELVLVLLAVSVLQILFSTAWLAVFRFGPLEWCWRSLTYWRRQPFRR